MSYDIQRKKFTREKFYLVELHLPYCDLEFGVGACPAAGTPKCYNTFKTCKAVEAYTASPKTYRFCSARSPLPVGIPNFTLPTVTDVSFTAPSIDVEGGLGVRAGVSVTMADAPSGDIGIDKYIDDRDYIPHLQGSFFGKLRARNPFYEDAQIVVYSGFLSDDGSFDYANMQRREYIVSDLNVGNGKAKLGGRDPLKLADGVKAKYPAKSRGVSVGDFAETDKTLFVSPPDVLTEYPLEGYIRMGSEVMSYTRSGGIFTVERGQFNTQIDSHNSGDTVQLCAHDNDRIDKLITKFLVEGASIPATYINSAEWEAEAIANYPVFLERLITEPEPVSDIIKELCESAPSYIYWDERNSQIRYEAVKSPPEDLPTLNDVSHMTGSLTYSDQLKMRISRVVVYLGQVDPTKKKDEISNYAQAHIRADFDAENAAGSPAIKNVYSRWLNRFNKGGAVTLATRLGRRFAQAPRLINFTLTSKDTDYWLGSSANLEHADLQSFDGSKGVVPTQIVSVAEKKNGYVYGGLEFYWGEPLQDDAEEGVNLIVIGADDSEINWRTIHDSLYPEPTKDTIVRIVIDTGVEVGAGTSGAFAADTGSWPVDMEPIELYVRGYAQGRGGNGADAETGVGGDGTNALVMNHDLTIKAVTGRIAGGAGGGGNGYSTEEGTSSAGGGGGAGIPAGLGGAVGPNATVTVHGFAGTRDAGGGGGVTTFAIGGTGGFPGQNGGLGIETSSAAGQAGAAIIKNGYTLIIEDGADNIKGAII